MNWKDKKNELNELINIYHVSYSEIGRNYGVTGSAIKYAAKRLGIVLPKKRSINPNEHFNKGTAKTKICPQCHKPFIKYLTYTNGYCSNKCKKEHEYQEYIKRWKLGIETGLYGKFALSNYIKRYMFEKHNHKCEKCGWGEVNQYTGRIPLQIHHIDGNCTNNNEDNLQLLCPNCHSLTNNYCGANKKATPGRTKYFGRDNHKSINN